MEAEKKEKLPEDKMRWVRVTEDYGAERSGVQESGVGVEKDRTCRDTVDWSGVEDGVEQRKDNQGNEANRKEGKKGGREQRKSRRSRGTEYRRANIWTKAITDGWVDGRTDEWMRAAVEAERQASREVEVIQ